MYSLRIRSYSPLLAIAFLASSATSGPPTPEFMSLESAKPVLQKMSTGDAAHPGPGASAKDWLAWLQKSDAEIRQRLETGEEDTLTNLLRFGVTFTKEYRIDDEYLVSYGQSSLVNAFAENRANDLIKALAAPNGNQGMVEMRAFVEKKGFRAQHTSRTQGAQSLPAGQSGKNAERISASARAGQGQPRPDVSASGHLAGYQPMARLRPRPTTAEHVGQGHGEARQHPAGGDCRAGI